MMLARKLLITLFAVSLVAAAEPKPRDLPTGSAIVSDGKAQADVYLFAGASGSRQSIVVKGRGALEILQLTPGGEVMNVSKGLGETALETVLSSTDLHMIVVTREDVSAPYSVVRTVIEPTVTEMKLASTVGYRFQSSNSTYESCWIEPGRIKRRTSHTPSGTLVEVEELAPGRASFSHKVVGDSYFDATKSYHIEGDDLVETHTDSEYKVQYRFPLGPTPFSLISPAGFVSYRC